MIEFVLTVAVSLCTSGKDGEADQILAERRRFADRINCLQADTYALFTHFTLVDEGFMGPHLQSTPSQDWGHMARV